MPAFKAVVGSRFHVRLKYIGGKVFQVVKRIPLQCHPKQCAQTELEQRLLQRLEVRQCCYTVLANPETVFSSILPA